MPTERKTDRESIFPSIINKAPNEPFSVELHGSHEVVAEGCLGVISCGNEQIKLNMGTRTLLLTGYDLVITTMFGTTVCISGKVISAEFI